MTIQTGSARRQGRPRRRRPPASGDLERIEQGLSDLVRLTSSARVHDARVRGSGVAISRTNLRFLDAVEELGPVSVSKLASRMDLSQPTASRALQQLESDGYVQRTSDPADGRVAFYSVTAGGLEAHQRMRTFMATQLADALRDLQAPRRSEIADAITELVARLSVQPDQPPTRNDEGNA
ncbi:MAG TPA: MarR family transcriptional regulator [Frankiaceae bacterium]|nr:MarR family transcriptional regulator [Frankiaceae bacterium]